MRYLIVCCDGTWNSPDQESVTNVRRLFNALDNTDPSKQLSHYVPGVGTEGGVVPRLADGGLGVGLGFGPGRSLAANVIEGYHWLITNYQPEDYIALFGFSRGAYTARSLAGLIAMCGLIRCGVDERDTWRRIKRVYHRYQLGYQDQRGRESQDGDQHWRDGLDFWFDPRDARDIPVKFIGVFDTVGSLGIPDPWRWMAPGFSSRRYEFNDVRLNPYVWFAYHALAMDEPRGPFSPTLWEEVAPPADVRQLQTLEQVWFPGSHMDVGGGHRETGLSDGALQWMIERAEHDIKLGFHPSTTRQIHPDPDDLLHDDDRTALGWLNPVLEPAVEPFLSLRPRAVPLIDQKDAPTPPAIVHHVHDSIYVHESVYQRQTPDNPPITSGPYRPTCTVTVGHPQTAEVFAREPWNDTGIYLEPGDYTFEAEGEWLDKDIPSGPSGSTGLPDWRQPVAAAEQAWRSVGSVIGACETLYRRVTRDEQASFIGAPREPNLPWMSLVGYVANNAVTVNGKANAGHQRIDIGAGGTTTYQVTRGGYLYAFANDAWGFYGNNTGSVRLTVTRKVTTSGPAQPAKPTPKPPSPQHRGPD
ncbi:DUF2235 domain-containing protein [Streptomyces sp. NPDC059340]|uniref:DUF2235 domain-containing protein n=1 Tax=Streptomyces sp. NPDC059340 TaxID=3346806 RepID=UPI00369C5928